MSSPPDQPRVRARYMKTFLQGINRLEPDTAKAVRDRIPPGIVEEIKNSGALAWLPVEANLAATKAVADTLSPEETRRFYENLLLHVYQTSMFRTFVKAAIRVVGMDPKQGMRYVGLVYPQIFKGCGEWRVVEASDGKAVLQLEDLPKACLQSMWLESVCGALCSIVAVIGYTGECKLEGVEPEARRVRYRLRWDQQPQASALG